MMNMYTVGKKMHQNLNPIRNNYLMYTTITFLNEPLALHICTTAIPGIISIDEKARVQPNHSAHSGYS